MDERRHLIITEATSWIGTPYISNGMIKGPRGGVDCGMILKACYAVVGLVPSEYDPRPYPPLWHVHRREEKYLSILQMFAEETKGPPERLPLPADLVLFKYGNCFSHSGIVIKWPMIIHAMGGDRVCPVDILTSSVGKFALNNVEQRFFRPKGFLDE